VSRWAAGSGLFFLCPEDGHLLRPMLPGLFGHLAYADGVLVVVTPTQVWGFLPDAKRSDSASPRSGIGPDRQRFDAVIDDAERHLANGNTLAARELLLRAARGNFPSRFRAWAAARLLLLTQPTDN